MAQVGLALADTLENRFGRQKRVAGADFTFQLFHKWGLGRECQTGMLIVVEHSVSQVHFISAGSGCLLLWGSIVSTISTACCASSDATCLPVRLAQHPQACLHSIRYCSYSGKHRSTA